MTFLPVIGLNGFSVQSSLNIENLRCEELQNDVYQLGIILHSPQSINENFMIKLRDCVVKLPEGNAVKKWMKWVANPKKIAKESEENLSFLTEIVNSQFNLITDLKVRYKIIDTLLKIPSNTLPEQLLRSYLYMIIGNVTRSDNILKEIINTPPRVNWEKVSNGASVYHQFANEQMKQIFTKLEHHPTDRIVFKLLIHYLRNFYNDESLKGILDKAENSDLKAKLSLRYVESISPNLVHFLNLSKMKEIKRITSLRDLTKYELEDQSYWFWAFLDIDPLISEALGPELKRLEKHDQLWFIYLISNEKLSDLFSKKNGKIFLPHRRAFLKEGLKFPHSFMLSLFKLIELGDINQELVHQTVNEITRE